MHILWGTGEHCMSLFPWRVIASDFRAHTRSCASDSLWHYPQYVFLFLCVSFLFLLNIFTSLLFYSVLITAFAFSSPGLATRLKRITPLCQILNEENGWINIEICGVLKLLTRSSTPGAHPLNIALIVAYRIVLIVAYYIVFIIAYRFCK